MSLEETVESRTRKWKKWSQLLDDLTGNKQAMKTWRNWLDRCRSMAIKSAEQQNNLDNNAHISST